MEHLPFLFAMTLLVAVVVCPRSFPIDLESPFCVAATSLTYSSPFVAEKIILLFFIHKYCILLTIHFMLYKYLLSLTHLLLVRYIRRRNLRSIPHSEICWSSQWRSVINGGSWRHYEMSGAMNGRGSAVVYYGSSFYRTHSKMWQIWRSCRQHVSRCQWVD